MNGTDALGKLLIGFGTLLILIGALVLAVSKLGWTWKPLPGDIVVRRGNFTLFVPIATSLLLSLLLTLLFWLLSAWRR